MIFYADAFDQRVELHWNANESGYIVRRSETAAPTNPDEGEFVYAGNGIHLIGVESDRGLENGTTYFYSIFSVSGNAPLATTSATPKELTPPPNLILNADFSSGLQEWTIDQPIGNYEIVQGQWPAVKMKSSATVASRLSQRLTGLQEKTLYTATVYAYGSSKEMPYTFLIEGNIQQEQEYFCCPKKQGYGPIIYSHIDETLTGYWRELRFVFWTGAKDDPTKPFDGSVTLAIIGPKVAEPSPDIFVQFSNVALQKGLLPAPKTPLDPKHPFQYPSPPLAVPKPGSNLVTSNWELLHAADEEDTFVLYPDNALTALATQNSEFYLKSPNHVLTAEVRVDEGKVAYLTVRDLEGKFSQSHTVSNTDWQTVSIPINAAWVRPVIQYSAYKQQGSNWHAYMKNVKLLANGGEWLPTAHAEPQIQLKPQVWDFTKGVFDPDRLLVLELKNSAPQNLSFSKEGLLFTAYGDQAKERPRQGAIIMTRDYFASGRYDVWAKVGPVYDQSGKIVEGQYPIGCSFDFWPFSYIEYFDGQPQWYDHPSPVRNTEIDIEMPADVPMNPSACPPDIRWTNGRLSAWGGQRGGIGGYITMHTPIPKRINAADGRFHKYSIEWNSGNDNSDGSRTPGWIKWYVDDTLWGEWKGNTYGFDNVPYRASRFYLGAWFPSNKYGAPGCEAVGWAGTPNWYRATFTVQKVHYTPPNPSPNRDRWEAETFSDHVWNPVHYPK